MEPISARVSPVVAETAHTDSMGVMQYQWDDRKSIKTTEMQMPRNNLEIPEPRIPRVFLDLAEEARNVIVENGRSCYMEEVQPQGTGLTRPVFVMVMVDSPPVSKKRALRATGVSTEMIPNMHSAGRCEPVGPLSTTEQPVLLGLNTDERGNASAGPVGPDINSAGRGEPVDPVDPDVMMYRNQSVTDGPVGQDKTRHPVGTEGMLAVNDSDRPTAGGPVGRLFKLEPLGPSRMSSRDEFNQPLAVGPVGQPFTTGPLGNHVRESDYKRTNRINSGPEGSTGILDPVNQTGGHIQTDHMKIGTVNGPASSGDTPPSSDSGVHSLGEQWENMSTNSIDMESEQNERPSYGDTTRRRVSDTSIPPNTEEGDTIDYPWTDCLLERTIFHQLLYSEMTGKFSLIR